MNGFGNSPTMGTAPNIFDQSRQAFTGGTNTMNFAMNPMAVPFTMNQFLNPYRDQVLTNALGRLQDRRAVDMNRIQAQAAQAGAFGGARHGLVEARLIEDYGRQEDELAARLLQEGFDTSANYGLQRIGQQAGIGANMVSAAPIGFNLGASALDRQNAAGMAQRALAQGVMDLASQQFAGYAQYPQTSLNTALSGLMGNPLAAAQTQTTSRQPGLFNYLSMLTGVGGVGK